MSTRTVHGWRLWKVQTTTLSHSTSMHLPWGSNNDAYLLYGLKATITYHQYWRQVTNFGAMGKINIKVWLQYIIFLGLGLGLVWYSSKDLTEEQVSQLTQSLKQTRFLYIIPVIVVMLISHYSRALRWIILMEPLGYRPGKANTYLTVLIGYFFNLLMPRLGEVMKCTMLARYEKIAPDKLVGTIVAERALDLLCLMLLTLLMVILQFDVLGQYTIQFFTQVVSSKSGAVSWVKLLALGLLLALVTGGTWYAFKRFGHFALVKRIKAIMAGVWAGLTSIRHIQNKGAFIFHTISIWLLYFLGIYLGFLAFPAVMHLGLQASLSLLVFGSVGMIATQGGIGAYQIAVQKTLLLFGIGAVAGLAFGWVMWAAQTAIVLLAGIVSIILLPLLNNRNPANTAAPSSPVHSN